MICATGRTKGTCVPECPNYGTCHCGCGKPTRIYEGSLRSRGYFKGFYCINASGHRINKTPTGCLTSTGVPRARVKPLVAFCVEVYGSLNAAAVGTGIPRGTLNDILYERGRKHVYPATAQQIVNATLRIRAHRHPDAPHTPRPPTLEERIEARRDLDARQQRESRARRRKESA